MPTRGKALLRWCGETGSRHEKANLDEGRLVTGGMENDLNCAIKWRSELTVRGVFESLLLHLGHIFPNDLAIPGVNELEAVEDIITDAP